MPRGADPEELHIEHVGYPCQWMPIRRVPRRERPADVGGCEPTGYVRGVEHVLVIRKVDKAGSKDWPKGSERNDRQGDGHPANELFPVLHPGSTPKALRFRVTHA